MVATSLFPSIVALGVTAGGRPYRLPENLEAYFKSRYERIDTLNSRLHETPDGPFGSLYILGSLLPRGFAGGATPVDRARGIAHAFLEQEAALLDITDIGAIKEHEVKAGLDGVQVVSYLRVGGLELVGMSYRIDVTPGGVIGLVAISLVPVSPDLESKVKHPTIESDDVRAIVVRDLAEDPTAPGVVSAPIVKVDRRLAIWREPFVVWVATASRNGLPAWGYTLDAFTGKILQKNCKAIAARASQPGYSPCGPYRLPLPAADLFGAPAQTASTPGAAPPVTRPTSVEPATAPRAPVPQYTIEAIRYATVPAFPLAELMMGAPKDQTIDIAMVVWLVRGGGRTVLFDTGFHRERWMKEFTVTDYLRPDEAVALTGVTPGEVTDIVVSHAHWDHMGGIDLFPAARVWIQKKEYAYYTGDAWQSGGRNGGVDPEDVAVLVRLNTDGRLRFVDGDDVEILPGIRAYTGARHTYASQYLRIDGSQPVVLASDNCYLDRNLSEHVASATFSDEDRAANLAAQKRMIALAGSADRVIPGHDPRQFERFPAHGRVARIR